MERGGCVGLTWKKTPMDSDDIMHRHHCPALSLSSLHCVDVVDASFLLWLVTWHFRIVLVVLGHVRG